MRAHGVVRCALPALILALTAAIVALGVPDSRPPINLNSPQPPADANSPAAFEGDGEEMLPYFDDYSWQTFLAMVWPAALGQRGEPDMRLTVESDRKPKVFETFKMGWELLHSNRLGQFEPWGPRQPGQAPVNWDYYEAAKYNACGATMNFGDLVLASFSKFSDMGQAGAGTIDPGLCDGLCGPLLARNQTFLHYLTAFNRNIFENARSALINYPSIQVGFSSSVQPGMSALAVKSAWMDMAGLTLAQQQRYYRHKVWVRDPNGACAQREMGLVGLHIVQRTLQRPQWIWSTFEQVDNVPPPDPLGSDGTFAFFKRGSRALPPQNPYPLNPIPSATAGLEFYNVVRTRPIHPSTGRTNLAYRSELRRTGSVWQNYQLVATQFPVRKRLTGSAGRDPANWFPGTGKDQTAFANVTMETFHQNYVERHSCLGCHVLTGPQTDFVWSVFTRPLGHIPGFESLSLQELRHLLSAQ
jgi:hypothetical protein